MEGCTLPSWQDSPRLMPPKRTPLLPTLLHCTIQRAHTPCLSPPCCFLLEPLVYVVHTTMRVTTQMDCLVYFCRPASASTFLPHLQRLRPTPKWMASRLGCAVGWLAGWLADCPVCAVLSCLSRAPRLDLCVRSKDPSCSLPRLAQAAIS